MFMLLFSMQIEMESTDQKNNEFFIQQVHLSEYELLMDFLFDV